MLRHNDMQRVYQDPSRCRSSSVLHRHHQQLHLVGAEHRSQFTECYNCQSRRSRVSDRHPDEWRKWSLIKFASYLMKLLHFFKGTTCFAFDKSSKTLATGEPRNFDDELYEMENFSGIVAFIKKGSPLDHHQSLDEKNFRLIKFLASSKILSEVDLFRAPFFCPAPDREEFHNGKISSLIINKIRIYLRFVLSSRLQQVDQIASFDCGIPLCRINRKRSYRGMLLASSSSSCKTPVPSSTRWTRARFVRLPNFRCWAANEL